MWHINRPVEGLSWVGDIKRRGGGLACRHLASLPASFVVVVALVLHDMALMCHWVVISKHRGGRQRCTYLASRWSSEQEGRVNSGGEEWWWWWEGRN